MRTDRFFACSGCRVRVYPVKRCPVCGASDTLVDLSRSRAPSGSSADQASDTTVWVVLLLAAAPSALVAVLAFESQPGLSEALIVLTLVCLLAALVAGVRARSGRQAQTSVEGGLEILPGPVARASAARESFLGTVAGAKDSLVAPISGGACVAFRVEGEGPGGALDDARGTTFDLKLADGGHVRVHGEIATMELHRFEAEEPQRLVDPDDELARWLRARGHDVRKGDVVCREALLRVGDLIEITGRMELERESRSYRGGEARRVLRDEPGSPLHIRADDAVSRPAAADAAADSSEGA